MSATYVVVCDDYQMGPYRDRETAERHQAQVEEAGHCHNDHRIEEVE